MLPAHDQGRFCLNNVQFILHLPEETSNPPLTITKPKQPQANKSTSKLNTPRTMTPAEHTTTGGRTPYTYTKTTTPWNRRIIIPLWLTQIAHSFMVFAKAGGNESQKYALPATQFPDSQDKSWCGSRMDVQIIICTGFAVFIILLQLICY